MVVRIVIKIDTLAFWKEYRKPIFSCVLHLFLPFSLLFYLTAWLFRLRAVGQDDFPYLQNALILQCILNKEVFFTHCPPGAESWGNFWHVNIVIRVYYPNYCSWMLCTYVCFLNSFPTFIIILVIENTDKVFSEIVFFVCQLFLSI